MLTKAYDAAYLRVTAGYIVYSVVTGFSGIVKTSDVAALDTDPPVEMKGYGNLVLGVLRFSHPAERPGVLRTFAFRFVEDSPLITAIRTACNLPEPEPEPEAEGEEERPDGYYDPEAGGRPLDVARLVVPLIS